MKRFAFLGLIVVLLAFTAIPVFAAGPNGHGNGGNAGQSNGKGNGVSQQVKDQTRGRDRGGKGPFGFMGNQPGNRMRTPFYLQGTIAAINGSTITVDVIHGNAQVKRFESSTMTLTVTITDTTKIFKIIQGTDAEGTVSAAPSTSSNDEDTPGNRVPITFGELAVGDLVAIHGNFVGGTTPAFNATLITLYVRAAAGQPETENP